MSLLFTDPSMVDHEELGQLTSGKLWAVYISEAEKYDKALAAGWKSYMEGLPRDCSSLCLTAVGSTKGVFKIFLVWDVFKNYL
jgi:hypothetical protein